MKGEHESMANGFIDTKRNAKEKRLQIIMGIAGILLLMYLCARSARYQVDLSLIHI